MYILNNCVIIFLMQHDSSATHPQFLIAWTVRGVDSFMTDVFVYSSNCPFPHIYIAYIYIGQSTQTSLLYPLGKVAHARFSLGAHGDCQRMPHTLQLSLFVKSLRQMGSLSSLAQRTKHDLGERRAKDLPFSCVCLIQFITRHQVDVGLSALQLEENLSLGNWHLPALTPELSGAVSRVTPINEFRGGWWCKNDKC